MGTNRIAYLFNFLSNEFQNRILASAIKKSEDLNAVIHAYSLGNLHYFYPERKYVSSEIVSCILHNYDGIVIIGCQGPLFNLNFRDEGSEFTRLTEQIPAVSVFNPIQNIPAVLIDNTGGIETVFSHLYSEHGCRTFLYIGGSRCDNYDAEQRYAGFMSSVEKYNIPEESYYIHETTFYQAQTADYLADHMKRYGKMPAAVICANDIIAANVIDFFHAHDVAVPQDCLVTGFDNSCISVSRNITTLNNPFDRIGEKSIESVIELIKGNRIPEETKLPVELICRNTCGCGKEEPVIPDTSGGFPDERNLGRQIHHLTRILSELTSFSDLSTIHCNIAETFNIEDILIFVKNIRTKEYITLIRKGVFSDFREEDAVSGSEWSWLKSLIPLFPENKKIVIMPIVIDDDHFGYSVFADQTQSSVFYENLGIQLASALRNHYQVEKLKESNLILEKMIREKELLMKEIHHRVKNNLQIISSLISLKTTDAETIKELPALKDIQIKVASISLVHEKVYRTSKIEEIEIKDYLRSLFPTLYQFYGSHLTIRFNIEGDEFSIPLEQCVPFGLACSEIFLNSFKYAFNDKPKDPENSITVRITVGEHERKIVIRDNGKGFPTEDETSKSGFGSVLLKMLLSEQMKAEYSVTTSPGMGTEYSIRIPLLEGLI